MKRSVTKKPKLTKWFDGSKFVPDHVGEYIASHHKFTNIRRWWDGARWSFPYLENQPVGDIELAKSFKEHTNMPIHFIGLAQNTEV